MMTLWGVEVDEPDVLGVHHQLLCSRNTDGDSHQHSVFQLGWKRAGCKRNWAQSSARTTKIRAQFSVQTTQNRHSLEHERPKFGLVGDCGYNHFYIGCLKTQKNNYILCLYCAIKDIVKTKLIFFLNYFIYIIIRAGHV